MDDASECLENILYRLHLRMSSCSVPHCISHRMFGTDIHEQLVCRCSATSEILSSSQSIQYVSAKALIWRVRQLLQTSTYQPQAFDCILRQVIQAGNVRDCPINCGWQANLNRKLISTPKSFAIGLVWSCGIADVGWLRDVFESVGTQIRLSQVFDTVVPDSSGAGDPWFTLSALVCCYKRHYSTFCLTDRGSWVFYDDDLVKECGSDWSSVVIKCIRSQYRPVLLIYHNRDASQLNCKTAMDSTDLAPISDFRTPPVPKRTSGPPTEVPVNICNGSDRRSLSTDPPPLPPKLAGHHIHHPNTPTQHLMGGGSNSQTSPKLHTTNTNSSPDLYIQMPQDLTPSIFNNANGCSTLLPNGSAYRRMSTQSDSPQLPPRHSMRSESPSSVLSSPSLGYRRNGPSSEEVASSRTRRFIKSASVDQYCPSSHSSANSNTGPMIHTHSHVNDSSTHLKPYISRDTVAQIMKLQRQQRRSSSATRSGPTISTIRDQKGMLRSVVTGGTSSNPPSSPSLKPVSGTHNVLFVLPSTPPPLVGLRAQGRLSNSSHHPVERTSQVSSLASDSGFSGDSGSVTGPQSPISSSITDGTDCSTLERLGGTSPGAEIDRRTPTNHFQFNSRSPSPSLLQSNQSIHSASSSNSDSTACGRSRITSQPVVFTSLPRRPPRASSISSQPTNSTISKPPLPPPYIPTSSQPVVVYSAASLSNRPTYQNSTSSLNHLSSATDQLPHSDVSIYGTAGRRKPQLPKRNVTQEDKDVLLSQSTSSSSSSSLGAQLSARDRVDNLGFDHEVTICPNCRSGEGWQPDIGRCLKCKATFTVDELNKRNNINNNVAIDFGVITPEAGLNSDLALPTSEPFVPVSILTKSETKNQRNSFMIGRRKVKKSVTFPDNLCSLVVPGPDFENVPSDEDDGGFHDHQSRLCAARRLQQDCYPESNNNMVLFDTNDCEDQAPNGVMNGALCSLCQQILPPAHYDTERNRNMYCNSCSAYMAKFSQVTM